jgi:excisionase family DNA binding protein
MYIEQQLHELASSVTCLEEKYRLLNVEVQYLREKIYLLHNQNYDSTINSDKLYTVKEAAKILKVTPAYVYELIRKGLLPALKLGSLKIRSQTLCEFLVKNEGYDLSDLDNIKKL